MPKRDKTVAELYRLHYEELLRKAKILLHDEEDARDAVSDVMARLMATDILPEGEKLIAYARSSVRFECLNRLKRMKLQERIRRALPLDNAENDDADNQSSIRDEEEQYQQYQQFIQTELTLQTQRVFRMPLSGYHKTQKQIQPMTQEEKLQRLLEMQEHPERYTEEEIRQLMTDEECRQLYEQMVRATDAIFSEKVTAKETTAIAPQRRWIQVAAAFIGVLMLSGIAYAAIHIISNVGGNMKSPTQEARVSIQQPQRQNQATEEITDSIPQTRIFENVPLDEMVSELASYYNKVADVQNAQAHDLRLYYKWELKDKIEDVMDDLNHFDHVNLVLEDDKLIVKP